MGTTVCEVQPLKPTDTKTSTVELATIFRSLGKDYLDKVNLTPRQKRAFRNITECRTAAKGGHRWKCSSCSHVVTQYNSCLDRHCPKCQGKARYQWVAKRMEEVVNTPYFHLVFTLPHVLNPLIAVCQVPLLNLLFRAVSQTLLAFGRDQKHLGGELGFITVLHTWTQKLDRHYHLHCIVPGGALSHDGTQWIPCKNGKYLFPEYALSDTFRRLFWHGSKELSQEGTRSDNPIPVKFKGLKDLILEDYPQLTQKKQHSLSEGIRLLEKRLYSQRWIVYAKQAFGGPTQVIKYLGCYTHRVAISNQRILSHTNGMVTFAYKDRKKDCNRTISLPEEEFASRFLQHVLPVGFMKIRSYGFLANRKKRQRVQQLHKLLGVPDLSDCQEPVSVLDDEAQSDQDSSPRICPQCEKPTLQYLSPVSEFAQIWTRKAIWDTS